MLFPRAFEDELLFGRIVRYLTMSGECPSHFVEKVLASSRHSLHPTLTVGITNLSKLTGDDAKSLLFEQTLAPLFIFFLPRHSTKLKSLFLGNNGNKALWESQFASFGQGSSCCLKWCPQCAREDVFNVGIAYWHRKHQISGVSACYKHSIALHVIELPSRQRLVSGLFPPIDDTCGSSVTDIESNVAIYSGDLLNTLSSGIEQFDWAQAYRNKLDERGYITRGNRVRRKVLFDDFFAFIDLYPNYGDSPLPKHALDYPYLSELLVPQSSHHPFRHLLLGTWLFERAEELLEYGVKKSPVSATGTRCKDDGIESRCLSLLKSGYSMSETSRLSGKSRCYLKRLALLHGVPLNLKPRKLTDTIKRKVLRLAQLCMHRQKIAERCSIGLGSVEQIISSQPGLVAWRKQCHFESKRRQCRVILKRFKQSNPKAIRQEIKQSCNKSFFGCTLTTELG
ncbi:transposition protein [Vibrio sp. JCM 19236]|nr:transposition protein [Vibrio sp. JCM 19236]